MNVGEIASGLTLVPALPAGARAILVGLSMEYLKKARGTITATCSYPGPVGLEKREHQLESVLTDVSGDVVARATARWLVGPEG